MPFIDTSDNLSSPPAPDAYVKVLESLESTRARDKETAELLAAISGTVRVEQLPPQIETQRARLLNQAERQVLELSRSHWGAVSEALGGSIADLEARYRVLTAAHEAQAGDS